ncbi:polysaccharide export protein [Sphingomonas sabuli]|uniref:Polysaccharide export protein n=1 Tax=Sphingomonas sabuli TaxID=2764186 RepID=A0A7G9L5A6_9SPHN|nr:polysaccharide biosynthesis/export family protein [Sphingomonas sabuli]QNM83805.1 polysaccharide export protein [Sphingomonas sabuli]
MYESQANRRRVSRSWCKAAFAGLALAALAGCSSLGANGPATKTITRANAQAIDNSQIQIIEVTDTVARRVLAAHRTSLFSQAFGDAPLAGTVIGPGDVLEVTIWEAPPAVLFGATSSLSSGSTSTVLTAPGMSQSNAIPSMMVRDDGTIQVPFAGAIDVVGRSPRQVENAIRSRLSRKAHDPQVAVRIASNSSSTVTVVGEVNQSTRVSLTPKGERLLDVIASAGGVKQPVDKTTIQVSRGGEVAVLPLAAVISDPSQNIRLAPSDVVTALYQPFSFIALGQTGQSAEIPFESTGLTLAQALGRVGGLKDDRADVRGAFIFRLEDPAALDPAMAATARRTPDGRVPVIYRVDMSNPATFFVAQSFPIQDDDVLYVSRAPLADLQRFVSIVASMAFPVLNVGRQIN